MNKNEIIRRLREQKIHLDKVMQGLKLETFVAKAIAFCRLKVFFYFWYRAEITCRNSIWRQPQFWIFTLSEFCTFFCNCRVQICINLRVHKRLEPILQTPSTISPYILNEYICTKFSMVYRCTIASGGAHVSKKLLIMVNSVWR